MVLTPEGHNLLPYAERLLALADEARQSICEVKPCGRLRLGAMESTAASRLPSLLAHFHRQWREVGIELAVATRDELIDQLRDFKLDAIFVAGPLEHADLALFECESAFVEELLLVTPHGHPAVQNPADCGSIRCSPSIAAARTDGSPRSGSAMPGCKPHASSRSAPTMRCSLQSLRVRVRLRPTLDARNRATPRRSLGPFAWFARAHRNPAGLARRPLFQRTPGAQDEYRRTDRRTVWREGRLSIETPNQSLEPKLRSSTGNRAPSSRLDATASIKAGLQPSP